MTIGFKVVLFIPRANQLKMVIYFSRELTQANSEKLFIYSYIIRWVKIEKQIPALFSTVLSCPHLMEEIKMFLGPITKVLIEKKSWT